MIAGDDGKLQKVLADYIKSPIDVIYGEDAPVRVQQQVIRRHGILMVNLRLLQSNLSFPLVPLQKVMLAVAHSHGWRMTDTEKEEAACRIARRIRNMCQHYERARSRTKVPKWAHEIDAMTGTTKLEWTLPKPPEPACGSTIEDEDLCAMKTIFLYF